MELEIQKNILTSTFGLNLLNCTLHELHGINTACFKFTDLSRKTVFSKAIYNQKMYFGCLTFKMIF